MSSEPVPVRTFILASLAVLALILFVGHFFAVADFQWLSSREASVALAGGWLAATVGWGLALVGLMRGGAGFMMAYAVGLAAKTLLLFAAGALASEGNGERVGPVAVAVVSAFLVTSLVQVSLLAPLATKSAAPDAAANRLEIGKETC